MGEDSAAVHGRDQALSLWSGSTDSKTLGYQRTNPRHYQIVRNPTKENALVLIAVDFGGKNT